MHGALGMDVGQGTERRGKRMERASRAPPPYCSWLLLYCGKLAIIIDIIFIFLLIIGIIIDNIDTIIIIDIVVDLITIDMITIIILIDVIINTIDIINISIIIIDIIIITDIIIIDIISAIIMTIDIIDPVDIIITIGISITTDSIIDSPNANKNKAIGDFSWVIK